MSRKPAPRASLDDPKSVRTRDIPLGAAVPLPQRGRRMVIRWYAANKVGEFHAQV